MKPSDASLPLEPVLRRDAWIRRQVQDLVWHLPARVETAELLQVALVASVWSARELRPDTHLSGRTARAWAQVSRQRIRTMLLEEIRLMPHLSRALRLRWQVLSLARQQLNVPSEGADATQIDRVATLSGLSLREIRALDRLAGLGSPLLPQRQGRPGLRSPRLSTHEEEVRARLDTTLVLEQVAHALREISPEHRRLLAEHLGLVLRPVTPAVGPSQFWLERHPRTPVWIRSLLPWLSAQARRCSDQDTERPACDRPGLAERLAEHRRAIRDGALQDPWPSPLDRLLRSA